MQNEISKIKISIAFNELLKNDEYREKIIKKARTDGECHPDTLELTDDAPTIVIGTPIEDNNEEEVPPFYVSLNVHDMILHNAMLDSGVSHNLMRRVVVESVRIINPPLIILSIRLILPYLGTLIN